MQHWYFWQYFTSNNSTYNFRKPVKQKRVKWRYKISQFKDNLLYCSPNTELVLPCKTYSRHKMALNRLQGVNTTRFNNKDPPPPWRWAREQRPLKGGADWMPENTCIWSTGVMRINHLHSAEGGESQDCQKGATGGTTALERQPWHSTLWHSWNLLQAYLLIVLHCLLSKTWESNTVVSCRGVMGIE